LVILNTDAIEVSFLVLLAPAVAWGWISRKSPLRRSRIEHAFTSFATKRHLAVLSVGLLALALRLALLPLHPVPQPGIVDEFSYLLAADTFASGRLSNPPHPFWVSFENLMILSQPTYASKYPPAQGLALALGIVLAGNAWVGVLLSTAAMCSAIVWMLQAWIPPRWALLGGLLAMARIAVGSYWVDSYWGGAVAATGGALLYGALPRLIARGRARDGLLLGIGLAVLANSRPYEGLLAATPAAITIGVWAFRKGRPSLRPLLLVLLPLVVAALAALRYNAAITGNPLAMPYQLHEAQYSAAPLFWFQKIKPEPVYRHPVMKAFQTGWARQQYLDNFTHGLLRASLLKLDALRCFFFGALLTVCLVALPWALRSKRLRLAFFSLGFVLAGMLLEIAVVPHYAAPVTGIFYLLVIQCLRQVRACGRIGLAVGRAIPVVLAGTLLALYSLEAAGKPLLHEPYSWCFPRPGNLARARILDQLHHSEGRHLILVRYDPNFMGRHEEWVYNRADIDSAKVIWAWEMDPEHDSSLIRYFHSRHVWRLESDVPHPELQPYSAKIAAPTVRP
jgi:hypothetical protein